MPEPQALFSSLDLPEVGPITRVFDLPRAARVQCRGQQASADGTAETAGGEVVIADPDLGPRTSSGSIPLPISCCHSDHGLEELPVGSTELLAVYLCAAEILTPLFWRARLQRYSSFSLPMRCGRSVCTQGQILGSEQYNSQSAEDFFRVGGCTGAVRAGTPGAFSGRGWGTIPGRDGAARSGCCPATAGGSGAIHYRGKWSGDRATARRNGRHALPGQHRHERPRVRGLALDRVWAIG